MYNETADNHALLNRSNTAQVSKSPTVTTTTTTTSNPLVLTLKEVYRQEENPNLPALWLLRLYGDISGITTYNTLLHLKYKNMNSNGNPYKVADVDTTSPTSRNNSGEYESDDEIDEFGYGSYQESRSYSHYSFPSSSTSSNSFFTRLSSLSLENIFHYLFFSFCILSILFSACTDFFLALFVSASASLSWSNRLVSATLPFVSVFICVISFRLAGKISRHRVIEDRASQVIRADANPEKKTKELNVKISIVVTLTMMAILLGIVADIYGFINVSADPSNPFIKLLGPIGIFVYYFSNAWMRVIAGVGLAYSCVILTVLSSRVQSAIERISTYQDFTSVNYTLRLLLDLDLVLSHASHKYASLMGSYFVGYFLKFALCAISIVTENHEKFVTRDQFGVDTVLDMIIHPCSVCLILLTMVALINDKVDVLIKTIARFTLFKRTKATHDKKLIKEMQIYAKTGSFTFNIFDHPICFSTISKIVALGVSLYIILLRFKRWGII